MSMKVGESVRLPNPPATQQDTINYLATLTRDLENILNSPIEKSSVLGLLTLDETVIVKTAEDLAGSLDSSKTYFIDGQIDMGTTSINVPEDGLTLLSDDLNIKGLYSTADNYTMFVTDPASSYAGNVTCRSMFIAVGGGTSQKYFNVNNTNNSAAFEFVDVNIGNFGFSSDATLGDVIGYRQFRATGCAFIQVGGPLTFDGTMTGGIVVGSSIALSLPAITLFAAGGSLSIQGSVRSDINFNSVNSAAVLFDFAESNIVQDGGFALTNVRTNADNIIPNLPPESVKVRKKNCVGVRNTYVGGQCSITTEATTVISAANTPTKMAGTTTYVDLTWFEGNNNNEFLYISDQPIEVECKGIISFSGGNNDQLKVYFRQWDDSASSYVDLNSTTVTLNGGLFGTRSEGVGLLGYTQLEENDRIEVWLENLSDSSNVVALLGGLVSITERPS